MSTPFKFRRLHLKALAVAACGAAAALAFTPAQAQGSYPNKPVKLIVPFAAGGSTDVGARVLAAWQDRENRPAEPELGPKRRSDLLALLPA